MATARGGRGGGRGGRGGRGGGRGGGALSSARGTLTIGGTELNWDLTGLDIQRGPAERFPDIALPQAPPPTADESGIVQHFQAVRDRIQEGPFYTILNDGMKDGLKRKAGEKAPTEITLFNPFMDNVTYSARYLKVRRRLPKLDDRPYVTSLFPPELQSILDGSKGDGNASKKRKILAVSKVNAVSQIERMIQYEEGRTIEAEAREEDLDEDAEEEEEEDEEDDKPDAVDEEDNWSAVSSDSEESDDDYNAEQYFDNGEEDDIDDADPYENTYE